MRLDKIVIDGFKSYAHRQELANLDSHFNAITGLNGSGKSNIFDAICFVMGITNLKKVRAEDPRELIFKNGNAGIQRASVTIEFVNDDPATAPASYSCADYPTITVSRQIVTNGRQKFFFCGKVADQSRVKQFFHSVSLNVDNPHFLVLQGTVHKLVNMRAAEILGWLEEAAGTRVFDARRRVAEHLIQSKEKKLEELNRTIDTEIGPMLLTMKAEQEEYTTFLRIMDGLDVKRKFRIAHTYWVTSRRLADHSAIVSRLKGQLSSSQTAILALPNQLRDAKVRKEETEGTRRAPTEALGQLHQQVNELKKHQATLKGQLLAAEKNIKATDKAVKTLAQEKDASESDLKKFLADAERKRAEFDQMHTDLDELSASVNHTRDALRLVKTGIQAGDKGKSLQEEKEEVQRELITLSGDISRLQDEIKRVAADAKELRLQVTQGKSGNEDKKRELLVAKQKLQEAQQAYDPYGALDKQLHAMVNELQEKKIEQRTLHMDLQATSVVAAPLQYEAIPGVNMESALHGYVGELFFPKDAKHSLSLSTSLIQHLNKVVIENDKMVQMLFQQGRLRQRKTFIPLNKTRAEPLAQKRVAEVQHIAHAKGGWADIAINLVSYDPRYEVVAQSLLGQVVVCSSLDIAKELAYNPATKLRSITLDGDSVDPTGLLAGGAAGNQRDILAAFNEAARKKAPLKQLRIAMIELQKKIAAANDKMQGAEELSKTLEYAQNKVTELEHQISYSSYHDAAKELENSEKKLGELETRLCEATANNEALKKEEKQLDTKAQESDFAKQEKELTAKLQKQEAELKALQKKVKASQNDHQLLDNKKAELEQKASDKQQELGEKQQEHTQLNDENGELKRENDKVSQQLKDTHTKIKHEDEKAAALQKQLEEIDKEIKGLQEQEDSLQKTIKDCESELKTASRSTEEKRRQIKDLERTHPFVVDESDAFGPADGSYYFEDDERTNQTLKELAEHEALSEAMSRKVNKKATVLYDQCKKEYDELVDKKAALQGDKEKIMEAITSVESRKWKSLDRMVSLVSRQFSTLFSTCLPGATARLVEERDSGTGRLTGLVVKVAFSGKEKESLTELSGGQRSLLALCLILAILRFRPAPVYILDEVDAALDPSHTQNIGKMLRQHFSDAQFLLVSLKDGMFSSANVIFEVRNTQGYSEVSRRCRK